MSAQPTPASPENQPKRSAVESIKENSRYLRGTLAEELAQDTDHFNEADKNLIKFHGSYQQDNRDARKDRHREGAGKYYMFMVRCKIPGGKVTAQQYLTVDELAGKFANGTLRFTSRQGIQFHGILKKNIQQHIRSINECLLTTLGACGDVNRNVMCIPAPIASPLYRQLQQTADDLAAHFAPRSGAYHEIWLNGQPALENVENPEPIYGKVYLPRKFKMGIALPEDNSIDLYAQDLGLLAIVEQGTIVGYNLIVGGGMGMTHGNANTFPFIGKPICYVQADQVLAGAEAVVKLFRDHGNRADRKRARIKYLVHDWGVDKFRDVLATYLPFPLVLPQSVEVKEFPLRLGWNSQGDGKFWYGVHVENGRVRDEGTFRLKTGLRLVVEKFRPSIRLTPMQDILLCDLPESARPEIERILNDHGVTLPGQISRVQSLSMACPAIPSCGLAITEAERALPVVMDELETEIRRLGLETEAISVRMTGCPNGCVRPYQSDIGIVGRSGDKYTLFVGGNVLGTRLSFPLKDLVPMARIVATLAPILADFKTNHQPGEGFGDYCQRLGLERLQTMLPA